MTAEERNGAQGILFMARALGRALDWRVDPLVMFPLPKIVYSRGKYVKVGKPRLLTQEERDARA